VPGVAQPPLSRRARALETAARETLVLRRGRGVQQLRSESERPLNQPVDRVSQA